MRAQESLSNGLSIIKSAKNGEFTVKDIPTNSDTGPTTKITHRIVLSGEDQKGFSTK